MLNEVLGRVVSVLMVTASLQLLAVKALANRVTVFDVRKSLPMRADEAVYHDYFINAGVEVGLRSGAIVMVTRRIPLHDPMQNRSQGDLEVPVAKLLVIHAQSNLAVARFHSGYDRKMLPTLEYDAVMAGDRIDVSQIEYDAGKGKGGANPSGKAAPATPVKEEREPAQVKAPSPLTVSPSVAQAPQLEVPGRQGPELTLPPQPTLNSEMH